MGIILHFWLALGQQQRQRQAEGRGNGLAGVLESPPATVRSPQAARERQGTMQLVCRRDAHSELRVFAQRLEALARETMSEPARTQMLKAAELCWEAKQNLTTDKHG